MMEHPEDLLVHAVDGDLSPVSADVISAAEVEAMLATIMTARGKRLWQEKEIGRAHV